MRRLLMLLVIVGMLISAGGCSREAKPINLGGYYLGRRVYTEEEIRRRAREKMEAEGWRVSITGRM